MLQVIYNTDPSCVNMVSDVEYYYEFIIIIVIINVIVNNVVIIKLIR